MFDFGNVLVHFDTQRFYDFLKAHQPRHMSGLVSPEEIFKLDCLREFDLGAITTLETFQRVKECLSLNIGLSEFLIEYTGVMKPDNKITVLRQVLRDNGIKTAVVSNINSYHFEYAQLVHSEVFTGFDYLALSFQLRLRKPDLQMWTVPASHLGINPDECIFVDDLKTNIDAFQRWGGLGHYYNVVDEKFRPNGWLEVERRRFIFRLANLGVISFPQACQISKVTI